MRKLALLCAPALFGQLLISPVNDYINKTTLLNNILSNARATAMSQKAQTAAVNPSAFTHAGKMLIPAQLAAKIGPQSEKQFEALVALYEQTAKKDGFPANDLAYALEYFLVNTYMTYNDLHDVEYSKDPRARKGKDGFDRIAIMSQKKLLQVTLNQERAVYQQCKSALGANPAVTAMTDRQKQELTEVLAITFGLNLNAYLDAVNREDDPAIERARQQAKAHLEKLTGRPANTLKIGATGLQF